MPKFVLLWTDAAMWLLGFAHWSAYVWRCCAGPGWPPTGEGLRATRRRCRRRWCCCCAWSSRCWTACTTGRCCRRRRARSRRAGLRHAHALAARCAAARLVDSREATYSRPLSYVGFTKESVEVNGAHRARRAAAEVRRRAPDGTRRRNGRATWPARGVGGLLLGLAAWPRCCRRCWRCRPRAHGGAGARLAAASGAARGRSPGAWCCWTLLGVCLLGGVGRRRCGPLPRARHRPDRQRRALPGAEEHPHRLRHRHAGHVATLPLAVGWASWRATSAAGSTRSSSTSTPCCRRCRTCC